MIFMRVKKEKSTEFEQVEQVLCLLTASKLRNKQFLKDKLD